MTSLEVAILRASNELGIPSEIVEIVYKAYWQAIKDTIQALPLKDSLTEEDFTKINTSINIPSIGKLYSSYDRVQGVKERFKYLQKISDNDQNKKTETNVY